MQPLHTSFAQQGFTFECFPTGNAIGRQHSGQVKLSGSSCPEFINCSSGMNESKDSRPQAGVPGCCCCSKLVALSLAVLVVIPSSTSCSFDLKVLPSRGGASPASPPSAAADARSCAGGGELNLTPPASAAAPPRLTAGRDDASKAKEGIAVVYTDAGAPLALSLPWPETFAALPNTNMLGFFASRGSVPVTAPTDTHRRRGKLETSNFQKWRQ